jgi:ABC-type antimicrobial peptide transport system permease subunit
MAEQLANDPLYRTLFGVLLLGAITALLLALAGNLVASWLNARARLASFAALRALGATPRQIAATLGWEQVIIYTTSMLLGLLFGWLLAILALHALIFTSIPPSQITGQIDSSAFYAGQSTPPLQIVIPPALWIVLGALILLCILALGIMVRVVSRPSIAQVLRLNED